MNQHKTNTYSARMTRTYDPNGIVFKAHNRPAVIAHIVKELGIVVEKIDGPGVGDILVAGGVLQDITKTEKKDPPAPPGLGLENGEE